MSTLKGHAKITRKAVEQLSNSGSALPAFGSIAVASHVVARDLMDVLILGHWADFGQCHHFMRRFDGQSQFEAYSEAIQWIRKNASDAARTLSREVHEFLGPPGASPAARARGPVGAPNRSLSSLSASATQSLGNALHAVQDSFAWGHVEREETVGRVPGAITRIKRYAGSEKDGHAEADDQWSDGTEDGFSQTGQFAIDATATLMRIVADSAIAARGDKPVSLLHFESFRLQWLRPSPSLSNERDRVFDLIDKHYTGLRLGASNLKTISMDEEGLADALVREAGTDSALVLGVFERLRDHYSSDSDDVAELYVNRVRKLGGPLEQALRSNAALVQVLIQVMDEGWTSSGEQDCIRYLKSLK